MRVHSFCDIDQAILMPGVRVGRHARIRRAIIDRDVLIPRGALIGYNPEEDRRRHTVTEGGVRRGTADDEPLIGPISEDALARGGGGRSQRRARMNSSSELRATCKHMTSRAYTAREILDSRGNPTVEVDVWVDGSAFGRAAVPSGASTGEREALELRDGDKSRYLGKGVRKAVANVNGEIASALQRQAARPAGARSTADRARRHAHQEPARRQRAARRVDGRRRAPKRPPAGARSTSTSRDSRGTRRRRHLLLPVPMMNILNGGAHADSSVDFQEFMVMPLGLPTFAEALRAGAEIFHALRAILKKAGHSTGVGDEGGFAPNLRSNREALDVVLEAIGKAGLTRRRQRLHRARRGVERALGRTAATCSRNQASRRALRRDGRAVRPTGSASTRSSRSKTASPKATGTAGRR